MKTGKLIFALVFLMLFADASMAAKWPAASGKPNM